MSFCWGLDYEQHTLLQLINTAFPAEGRRFPSDQQSVLCHSQQSSMSISVWVSSSHSPDPQEWGQWMVRNKGIPPLLQHSTKSVCSLSPREAYPHPSRFPAANAALVRNAWVESSCLLHTHMHIRIHTHTTVGKRKRKQRVQRSSVVMRASVSLCNFVIFCSPCFKDVLCICTDF